MGVISEHSVGLTVSAYLVRVRVPFFGQPLQTALVLVCDMLGVKIST